MARKQVGAQKGGIPLAVDAVRNLENFLMRVSRKRKLTSEQRQKLRKYASYLKGKRKRSATRGEVILSKPLWRRALRFLACIAKGAGQIKNVFDELMGGK